MTSRIDLAIAFFILQLLITAAVCPVSASTDPELRKLLKEAIESDAGFEDRFDAQVWLLDMSRRLEKFVTDPKARIELLKQVHYEARRVGIEPELVLAVIEVESRFDKFAISVSGARGLMQVMPFWLNEIGISDNNLFKIRTNLRMGCTILRYYIDMEPDNLGRALARYNGSLGKNIYPNKVITALRERWFKQ
ncbi:MAG: lytic transglycosylase domain-containing protein [Gammaproteobacteria bacterium]|nr:lytic transglycosylase domain-containing protein [Gammaproteobacteria bacterium]MDH3446579.1 lytic transglycosylase domain-containing protein [Gammaproteobacteria bacterium]